MFIRFGGKIVNMAKFKCVYKVGASMLELDDNFLQLCERFATEKERDERFEELENILCDPVTNKVVNLQAVDKDKIYIIDINGQPKQKGYYYVMYAHNETFEQGSVLRWDGTEWTDTTGCTTVYGNKDTQGEKYKLKELDSNQ